ncbi:MAG: hypothetical protein KF847_13585 [Pirellulales bacterium]|nr:hypothetical protein [Pirellulales bacterium]
MNRLRRGTSLIEMLVVITFATTLMGIGIQLICTARCSERTAAEQVDLQRTAARLSRQFRADVAACRDATFAPNPSRLRLDFGAERTVEWRVAGRRVERSEPLADGAERRECYVFPPRRRCRLQLAESPPRAELTVAPLDFDGGALLPYELQIAATPMRWRAIGVAEEVSP